MSVRKDPRVAGNADRIPPHNLEAEMALIGSVLVDWAILPEILPLVSAGDFYAHVHETIFGALVELFDRQQPLDKISLAETLRKRDQLEKVGGLSYLSSLMDTVQTAASAIYYARIVREKSQLRSLIHAGTQITQLGYEAEEDVETAIDASEQLVFAVRSKDVGESVTIEHAALTVYRSIIEGKKPGLSTGFSGIDQLMTGYQPGHLYILGARPGMGKTSFALGSAAVVARSHPDAHVVIFSLEMAYEELAERFIAARANLDLRQLRTGEFEGVEWERVSDAADWVSKLPITIEEAYTLERIVASARRLHARRPISLIIVDYLQLVTSTRVRSGANLNEIVTAVSRSLKLLARELRVPVLALSQLNREVENRAVKRPQLSDLRESGAIEQDADLVAFIHRDAKYDDHADPFAAEFIIAKQRNGPVDTIPLRFVPMCARFEE